MKTSSQSQTSCRPDDADYLLIVSEVSSAAFLLRSDFLVGLLHQERWRFLEEQTFMTGGTSGD